MSERKSQQIKALIFDVGGVLMRTDDPAPRARLEQRLGLTPGQAELLVFNGPEGQAAQRGEISSAALWRSIGAQLQMDEEAVAQFRQEFFAGDFLNLPLLRLIRRLRSRYQTAILSNFMEDLRRMLREEYPMTDAFDCVVISAEEGVTKPDPAVYWRVLARLGRQPQEAVFIDDFRHNIAAARAVGLHAIHYTPQTDVAAELAKLGVSAPGTGAQPSPA